jgi:hypothetical protein
MILCFSYLVCIRWILCGRRGRLSCHEVLSHGSYLVTRMGGLYLVMVLHAEDCIRIGIGHTIRFASLTTESGVISLVRQHF